jgi:hypothetical protein
MLRGVVFPGFLLPIHRRALDASVRHKNEEDHRDPILLFPGAGLALPVAFAHRTDWEHVSLIRWNMTQVCLSYFGGPAPD